MKSDSNVLFYLLTCTFIHLKLSSAIDWSWWMVLAPLWIPLTVGFLLWTGARAVKKNHPPPTLVASNDDN